MFHFRLFRMFQDGEESGNDKFIHDRFITNCNLRYLRETVFKLQPILVQDVYYNNMKPLQFRISHLLFISTFSLYKIFTYEH